MADGDHDTVGPVLAQQPQRMLEEGPARDRHDDLREVAGHVPEARPEAAREHEHRGQIRGRGHRDDPERSPTACSSCPGGGASRSNPSIASTMNIGRRLTSS